jgi:hypothetical protein
MPEQRCAASIASWTPWSILSDLGRPGGLRRSGADSSSCSKPRRGEPILDPVRVFGEQGNHKVERLDLFLYAPHVGFFLLQNFIWILHFYLPTIPLPIAVREDRQRQGLQTEIDERATRQH